MEKSEKNEIRKWVKEQRKALDAAAATRWNEAICEQLLNLEEIRRAFCVYCYASLHHEAGTWKLIESLLKQGKYIAVPKVAGRELEFYAIFGKTDLEEGVMGIMEPKPSCLKIHDLKAPVIVPGIAFDKTGNRIGYGGGYYDRFFEREPHHLRIAIAYGFQMFDRVPAESHDICMDRIITP
ncbi:5-formyltetrahydrofolate cyclo-ligase [Clostridium sp. Marseille-P2415]|uniref:5-formyltetrahydrofolate cyclo-ligase n=1 Tax=Clostridium sp. Marseille-P2415 TaxID=1805471 RepID=UPI0009887215|nr:5-formyltetrahydrofolate cyclo-ligase [Clostridium sp. Marseille-P2415]